jgi:hypothetical protein
MTKKELLIEIYGWVKENNKKANVMSFLRVGILTYSFVDGKNGER